MEREMTLLQTAIATATPFAGAIRNDTTAASEQPKPSITGEIRRFGGDVVLKRTSTWTAGKAVLVDRQARTGHTEFAHCLARHTIALHVEGANTQTALRYDNGAQLAAGCTLGQAMFIPASHRLEGWSDFPAKVRHVVVLLDPATIEAELRETGAPNRLELPFCQAIDDDVILGRMRALQSELDNPGLLGRFYIESLGCEIATRLVRRHAVKPVALQRGGLPPRKLRMVKEYIAANLSNEITLCDLAAIAGVSNAHFCRAFRRSVGLPSHRYILRQRVELAKRMLVETEMPIAEIALGAGFGDQSHLTKHFRCFVGTTPWRFRSAI